MQREKVIAVVGPTSSGKSALGVFLAKKINGEVISADSRQVYKGLDIGTGKITKKEMLGIPHHLLDIASPKKIFTASDFVERAKKEIVAISRRSKVPILVGGTGFYTDALLGRLTIPEVAPNPKLRARLEKLSTKKLFAMLKKKDPRRASTIEPEHKRRLIRALEITGALGKNPKPEVTEPYDVLWLGLRPSPAKLKKNIHIRLLVRIRQRMIDEAKRLHTQGLSYKRMKELGLEYRYMALYLQKKITKKEMLTELERAINRYAKRQMKWFKRNPHIVWLSSNAQALQLSRKFLIKSK